jgi:hypothetical protein
MLNIYYQYSGQIGLSLLSNNLILAVSLWLVILVSPSIIYYALFKRYTQKVLYFIASGSLCWILLLFFIIFVHRFLCNLFNYDETDLIRFIIEFVVYGMFFMASSIILNSILYKIKMAKNVIANLIVFCIYIIFKFIFG